jgi:cell division protein FtsW
MKKELVLKHNLARNRDIRRVAGQTEWLQPARRMNSGLFIITLVMICFGLVMLFSASMSDGYASKEGNPMYYIIKQTGITAVGLIAAMFVALAIPVKIFDHFWMTLSLYAITSGLLVYVKFFGFVMNGARRWVSLFGITFQPSELAKLAMVFCFAGYVAMIRRTRAARDEKRRRRGKSALGCFLADGWLDILIPAGAFLVWIALIIWQPHVSCAVILCFIMLVIFLSAGIPARSWISGITQILVIACALTVIVSATLPMLPKGKIQQEITDNFEHVKDRLDSFTNPEAADPDDTYQIDQSIIAIGSGGLAGLGLGSGRQKYNYLPEAHNDFIFAIIGEELGFIGTVAVVILFVLFMLIGVSITVKAGSAFSAILAGGYTMLISIQALLNIAVATRTIPATGISLPFFSYGGTSNFFFLMAIGFILAVSRTGQKIDRPARMQAKPEDAGIETGAVPRPDLSAGRSYP